jgi:hypothetical protein
VTERPIMGDGDPSLRIDLGSGFFLQPLWYDAVSGRGKETIVGWTLFHPLAAGGVCAGSVALKGTPFAREGKSWVLVAGTLEAPIELAPSIRCHCGVHGWIRGGRWVAD